MSVLARKLVRDLWRSRWQYLAVSVMVMMGVAFFGASYLSYQNLDSSYNYSYDLLRFEDFGMKMHAAPESATERIRRIAGVTAVEGRLVEDVIIELPGRRTRKLIGRLISIPATRRPAVDDVLVVEGRYLSSPTAREVLLENSFARHQGLHAGDVVEAVQGAGRVRFHIVGIVKSPEYVFVVRSKQDLMPFPDTFGVLFVSRDVLGPLSGKGGIINEVRARVADPARLPAMMREARRILNVYGPEDPVPREDQPSHQLLEQDLHGFQVYAILFPLLFLSVSGMTVYTLMMRLVHQQRPVIGLLRGLGFSRGAVVMHYLGASGLIGLLASAAGSALGYWLAGVFTRYYMTFVAVAQKLIVPRWGALIGGFLGGAAVCVVAGIVPARAAAQIRPAETLRGEPPRAGRTITLDRVFRRLPLLWRIPLRNVFRQPRRTVSTLLGIIAGILLMMIGRGMEDSVNAAMDLIVSGVFKDDIRVEFMGYSDASTVNRVRSWPGVLWAEGVLDVPVDFAKGDRTYSALLSGLDPNSRLYTLATPEGAPLRLNSQGMILGQTLQSRLKLENGDMVHLSLPRTETVEEPEVKTVRAAGFNWEPISTVAYMPREQVRRLFRDELALPATAVSSIRIKADSRYEREIKEKLLELPNAGAVLVLSDLRSMLNELFGFFQGFVWAMLLSGMALAFSIVFNMITINVLERSSEVATMRTLGVSRRQIAAMITLENAITSVLGVALGLPLGRWFVSAFLTAGQTREQAEVFTMKAVVYPATYLVVAVAMLLAVVISQAPSLRYINRLDLSKATKERAA